MQQASPCLRNGCSLCCRDTQMPLSLADAERISVTSGMGVEEFTVPVDGVDGYLQLANDPATRACVFLETASADPSASGRCSIHSDRPEGCRHYPFIIDADENIVGDDICPHVAEFPSPTKKQERVLRALDKSIERERRERRKASGSQNA